MANLLVENELWQVWIGHVDVGVVIRGLEVGERSDGRVASEEAVGVDLDVDFSQDLLLRVVGAFEAVDLLGEVDGLQLVDDPGGRFPVDGFLRQSLEPELLRTHFLTFPEQQEFQNLGIKGLCCQRALFPKVKFNLLMLVS